MAQDQQGSQTKMTEEQIIDHFNGLRQEQNNIMNKIAEVEQDRHEYSLVADTLAPLDPQRKCHRLVGGILIERTVAEVLPEIRQSLDNFNSVLGQLGEALQKKEREIEAFMTTHKIRLRGQDGDAQQQKAADSQPPRPQQPGPGGGSVLA